MASRIALVWLYGFCMVPHAPIHTYVRHGAVSTNSSTAGPYMHPRHIASGAAPGWQGCVDCGTANHGEPKKGLSRQAAWKCPDLIGLACGVIGFPGTTRAGFLFYFIAISMWWWVVAVFQFRFASLKKDVRVNPPPPRHLNITTCGREWRIASCMQASSVPTCMRRKKQRQMERRTRTAG